MAYRLSILLCLMGSSLFAQNISEVYSEHKYVSDFFITSMKDHGAKSLSLEKLQELKSSLSQIRKQLADHLYETVLIEQGEDLQKKSKKILEKAQEEKEESKIIRGLDEYLLPMLKQLIIKTQNNQTIPTAEMDNFLHLLSVYKIRGVNRTRHQYDSSYTTLAKRFFTPYKFAKSDITKKPAVNLSRVSAIEIEGVKDCLNLNNTKSTFLYRSELEQLLTCGVDISKIDIIGKQLIKKPKHKNVKDYFDSIEKYFPKKNQILTLKKVSLGSAGSPKIIATYEENGKKKKMKLKFGREVHSDTAMSALGELIGFNQDKAIYRHKVKVYLGKFSYEEFKRDLINKYGKKTIPLIINDRGSDKNGEFVLFNDVLMEAKPKSEIRLSGFEMNSWDYPDKREYRSLLLWFGLINIHDVKTHNAKTVIKTKSGEVLHRYHDMGYTLGADLNINKFKDPLEQTGGGPSRVNLFSNSYIQSKDNEVSVWWNDFFQRKDNFKKTTYFDLKWMARKILNVQCQVYHDIFPASGMPYEVGFLYTHKIIQRRNELLFAFDLQNEYSKCQTINLEHLNLDGVQNGKLIKVQSQRINHVFQHRRNTLLTVFNLLKYKLNLFSFQKNFANKLKRRFEVSLENNSPTVNLGLGQKILGIKVLPELTLQFTRRVEINRFTHQEGSSHNQYVIIDELGLGLNLDSPNLASLKKLLPIDLSSELKVIQQTYRHHHYANDLKSAYLSPWKLTNFLLNRKNFIKKEINRFESITSERSYGFKIELRGQSSVGIPLLTNDIGVKYQWLRSKPIFYFRNENDSLNIFHLDKKEKSIGLSARILNLDLVIQNFPLLGGDILFSKTEINGKNIVFSGITNKSPIIQRLLKQQADSDLDIYLDNPKSFLMSSKASKYQNFSLSGKIKSRRNRLKWLFKNSRTKEKNHAHFKVVNVSNEQKEFLKINDYHEDYSQLVDMVGVKSSEAFTRNVHATYITIETDQETDHTFLEINLEDYYAQLSKDKLSSFISDINKKFSRNTDVYTSLKNQDIPARLKKIYLTSRIFLQTDSLIDKLPSLLEKNVLECHFKSMKMKFSECLQGSLKQKHRSLKRKIKKLISKIRKPNKVKRYQKLIEILNKLKIKKYGAKSLIHILGEDGMRFSGEIYGLYPSINMIQEDTEEESNIRYSAKSWGNLKLMQSPIRKYLRKELTTFTTTYIDEDLMIPGFFGQLRRGRPQMSRRQRE